MEATYIGFDGAQYAAKFSPASAKLGGKVSVGILRVFRNHIMVDERITTAAKSSEFFRQSSSLPTEPARDGKLTSNP